MKISKHDLSTNIAEKCFSILLIDIMKILYLLTKIIFLSSRQNQFEKLVIKENEVYLPLNNKEADNVNEITKVIFQTLLIQFFI